MTKVSDLRVGHRILGVFVDALVSEDTATRVIAWAKSRESRSVFLCNAHSVVTAGREPGFADVLAAADLAAPDGMPVAWMLRRLGHSGQPRVDGPGLMLHTCALAAERGVAVFLYGSDDATLAELDRRLREAFPGLVVAGRLAPPFREATPDEDRAAVERINASGAGIAWVALGCPKQERWIAAHKGRIRAVMIGVGAAFDYHAGTLRRAPRWMREAGLEWLHRLWQEPHRLWRRYLVTNTLFVIGALRQLAGSKREPRA